MLAVSARGWWQLLVPCMVNVMLFCMRQTKVDCFCLGLGLIWTSTACLYVRFIVATEIFEFYQLCDDSLTKYRASDKCQREKRKTINGDDLLWAMSTLGFEDYVEPLKVYLHKYREVCPLSLPLELFLTLMSSCGTHHVYLLVIAIHDDMMVWYLVTDRSQSFD